MLCILTFTFDLFVFVYANRVSVI